jgi:hypothetical protein
MPTSAVAATGAVGAFTTTAASVLSVRNVILNGLTGAVFTQYSIFMIELILNAKIKGFTYCTLGYWWMNHRLVLPR